MPYFNVQPGLNFVRNTRKDHQAHSNWVLIQTPFVTSSKSPHQRVIITLSISVKRHDVFTLLHQKLFSLEERAADSKIRLTERACVRARVCVSVYVCVSCVVRGWPAEKRL